MIADRGAFRLEEIGAGGSGSLTMETASHIEELPRRFGADILLLARIGCGGMGEVFLARKTGPGGFEKELVVKRILPHLARDPRFVQMFLEEARLAARLNHPHIAHIYDFGQVEGEYFLAMEHVPGRDLHWILERCRQKRMRFPLAHVPQVGIAVCRALEYAQRLEGPDGYPLRIVHRDISPTNILVSDTGHVKLLDFGIARSAEALRDTTLAGRKGKALYMSPEQMRGLAVDGRSDVFSLGAVLFELCTGTTHMQAGTRSPRQADGGAPPRALDRIVRKALSERPEDRYQTAARMEAELAALPGPRRGGATRGGAPLSGLLATLVPQPAQTLVSETPLDARGSGEPEGTCAPAPTAAAWKDLPPPARRPGRARGRGAALASIVTMLALAGVFWVLREPSRGPDRHESEGTPPGHPTASTRTGPDLRTAHHRSGGAEADPPAGAPDTPKRAPGDAHAGPDWNASPNDRSVRREDPGTSGAVGTWEGSQAPAPVPTPPAPAPPEAAPTPWRLRLTSIPPGANVWLDDVPHDARTPCTLSGTGPAEARRVRVVLAGYRPWEKTLAPGSFPDEPLTARLEAEPGSLSVSSRPPGARILLDGQATGRNTPARFTRLPAGRAHRIELEQPGYAPWQGAVTLEPGQTRDVEIVLTPATGGIRLQTVPWTEVYLDGGLLGKTPLQREGIPAGQHTLTLINGEAGIRASLSVTIEAGEILKQRISYQGSLRVECEEPAHVLVNDVPAGTTPCDDIPLTAGTYTVVLRSLDGDRERRFQVQVHPDRVTTVSTTSPPR